MCLVCCNHCLSVVHCIGAWIYQAPEIFIYIPYPQQTNEVQYPLANIIPFMEYTYTTGTAAEAHLSTAPCLLTAPLSDVKPVLK